MQEVGKEGCAIDARGISAPAASDWHQVISFARYIPRRRPSIAAPRLMKLGAPRLLRAIAHAAIKLRRFFGIPDRRCLVSSHA